MYWCVLQRKQVVLWRLDDSVNKYKAETNWEVEWNVSFSAPACSPGILVGLMLWRFRRCSSSTDASQVNLTQFKSSSERSCWTKRQSCFSKENRHVWKPDEHALTRLAVSNTDRKLPNSQIMHLLRSRWLARRHRAAWLVPSPFWCCG